MSENCNVDKENITEEDEIEEIPYTMYIIGLLEEIPDEDVKNENK